MKYYLEVLKKYATFSGRARRSEYWYFVLFNFIFMIVAIGLDNLLGTTVSVLPYGYFYFALALAVLIPGLAVFVRRMHDIGKSGWWYFIAFIPLVGAIWLLVLCCTEGVSGDNEYGADPKLEAEI
jgi:uncharacterized membrane protein YhaH (DUF805 family)